MTTRRQLTSVVLAMLLLLAACGGPEGTVDAKDIKTYDRLYRSASTTMLDAVGDLNQDKRATRRETKKLTDVICDPVWGDNVRQLRGRWDARYPKGESIADVSARIKKTMTEAGWTYELGEDDITYVFTRKAGDGITLTAFHYTKGLRPDPDGDGGWTDVQFETNCIDVSDEVYDKLLERYLDEDVEDY